MTMEYRTQMKPVAVSAETTQSAIANPGTHNYNPYGATNGVRGKSIKTDRVNRLYDAARDIPRFCDTLSFSAGRERSFTPAATRHHFMSGAQKKTVFGPGGVNGDSTHRTLWSDADPRLLKRLRRTCGVVHERLELGRSGGRCCSGHGG